MTNFHASIWDRMLDQRGHPCWANRLTGKVSYQLQDCNGLPIPYYSINCPAQCLPGAALTAPVGVGMAPMGVVPTVSQHQYGGSVAMVGAESKEDEWDVYTHDETGKTYYHNSTKNETTWTKPDGFVEKKNDCKPPPPPTTEEKEEEPVKKYIKRPGWI